EHAVNMVAFFLTGWARQTRAGRVLPSGYKVRVSEKRGVMPDVQFFAAENLPKAKDEKGLVTGRPDLVVEVVSSSSRRYDRVIKLGYYCALGVPEYWLVDPEARTLERLVLHAGKYVVEESLEGENVLRPASMAGLEIPLAELWLHTPDED